VAHCHQSRGGSNHYPWEGLLPNLKPVHRYKGAHHKTGATPLADTLAEPPDGPNPSPEVATGYPTAPVIKHRSRPRTGHNSDLGASLC
jgi:hypothetical protein